MWAVQPCLVTTCISHTLACRVVRWSGEVTLPVVGIPSLAISLLGGIAAISLWYIIESSPKTPKPDTPNSKQMGETMQDIHENIAIGARAFLKQEYSALAVAAAILFILVSAAVSWKTGICYLCGVITSATCGYIGMMSATMANVRTAAAAEIGLNAALRVSFNSGSVMLQKENLEAFPVDVGVMQHITAVNLSNNFICTVSPAAMHM